MKTTKQQLKQLIKEEIQKVLNEEEWRRQDQVEEECTAASQELKAKGLGQPEKWTYDNLRTAENMLGTKCWNRCSKCKKRKIVLLSKKLCPAGMIVGADFLKTGKKKDSVNPYGCYHPEKT